ncbi:MAG: 4-amino-4-deoxy-L-arabinose transferase, partial [Cyanobacteria bacterium P01_H01_bin.152]
MTSIVCTALFWNLGARSLADWDEAIYAQISKEIFHSNQWLTLHWGYKPWFHKPPLFMWLTTLAYYIFGVGEVGARAISAIAGTGLALLTYLLG